jgi:hypothetical protein
MRMSSRCTASRQAAVERASCTRLWRRARLTIVPSDVQCVEITGYDGRYIDVRTDVTPGSSPTILIKPVDPGSVTLSGQAFSVPCSETYYYVEAGDAVTWVADPTSVEVFAGRTTEAQLHFHQLGGVDVGVSFDNSGYCTGDDASFVFCPPDAGLPIEVVGQDAASAE